MTEFQKCAAYSRPRLEAWHAAAEVVAVVNLQGAAQRLPARQMRQFRAPQHPYRREQ